MTHCSLSKAKVSDLFVSIQGEGPLVGVRQAFVRLSGCNLSCNGCDTDFSGKFVLDWREVLDFVEQNRPVHSIAITGGEPLLQVQFLTQFLPAAKESGYKIYLETNSTLPQAYLTVKDWIDFACCDVKLPSVWGVAPLWDEHREFFRVVRPETELIVKVVLSSRVQEGEFDNLVDLLFSARRDIIIVLQPFWPIDKSNLDVCLDWQRRLMQVLGEEVRVIPQVHKFLEVK